jgi:hypothetical protein
MSGDLKSHVYRGDMPLVIYLHHFAIEFEILLHVWEVSFNTISIAKVLNAATQITTAYGNRELVPCQQ